MSCQDCYNGCVADKSTFDKCVQYTGADIDELDICTGDSLKELDAAIVTKLLSITDGTSITLSSLNTGCTFFSSILGVQTKNVANIVQALVTGECSLKTLIDALSAKVNSTYSFNTDCLSDLPTSPTIDDIIQATINLACQANTIAAAIEADYVKASELDSLIAAYIAGQTSIQYNTRMVPGVVYPYVGSVSNFDSSGKGISANGFDKVYIYNGLNGTMDGRGRVFVGANFGIPGGLLATAVDPSTIANAGYAIAMNTNIGTYTETLDTTKIPAHTHGVTDPGHTHTITGLNKNGGDGNNVVGSEAGTKVQNTTTSTTGITIASTGGTQPHNNTQPSFGGVYIIYIP